MCRLRFTVALVPVYGLWHWGHATSFFAFGEGVPIEEAAETECAVAGGLGNVCLPDVTILLFACGLLALSLCLIAIIVLILLNTIGQ